VDRCEEFLELTSHPDQQKPGHRLIQTISATSQSQPPRIQKIEDNDMAFGVTNYLRRAALLTFAPNHLQIIALAKDPNQCLAQQPVFEQEEDTYGTMSGCLSFSAVFRRFVQTRATVPGDLHVEPFLSANALHSTLALTRRIRGQTSFASA
jgi:hypothetical protein